MAAGALLDGRLAMAFATPVASRVWPDSEALNAALAAEITRRAGAEAGLTRSNTGGWHSGLDLFHWRAEGIAELRERVQRLAGELVAALLVPEARRRPRRLALEGWANLSRAGDYHAPHNHPGAHWSGVYYVTAGGSDSTAEAAGKLELLDPRPGVNMVPLDGALTLGRTLVTPEPGLMVCFPSWLTHLVHPFSGPGTRIAIAFNVTVVPERR